MVNLSKREAIIGLGMAMGGISTYTFKSKKSDLPILNLDGIIPKQVGEWTIGNIDNLLTPQPSSYARSIYEKIAIKHYLSDTSRPITLVLAYGRAQSYSSQLHRPEVCYPASGFKIVKKQDFDLLISEQTLKATYLHATRGARQDGILFWTRIGNNFPTSLTQQRLEIARAAFERRQQDGIVFRLSCPWIGSSETYTKLTTFAGEFSDKLTQQDRRLLLGSITS